MNKKYIIVFFICLVISGILGQLITHYPNFDFYSYHYVNAWSFLNDRINIDFMTAQARSYYNPVLDVINYFIIQKLNNHPYIFLFISNFKYGLFLFITYLISDLVFFNKQNKRIALLSMVTLVVFSPVVIFAMSVVHNDIQIANLILISFYLLIRYIFEVDSGHKVRMLVLSAFILGCAAGLKNATITFVIPMVISTAIYLQKDSKYIKTMLFMLFGGILGFLICDGWWLYTVWQHFGNPVFPYSNHIFKSQLADISNYTAVEYEHVKPKSTFDFFFAFLKDTIENPGIWFEPPYFEPKMRLGFVSVIIAICAYNFKSFKVFISKIIKPEVMMICIIYTVLGFYANCAMLGTLRYIIALAVITSVVIVALALCNTMEIKGKTIYPAIILVLLYSVFYYHLSLNNMPIEGLSKIITISKADITDGARVLCGNQQACFVAPVQNKNIKYCAFAIPKHIKAQHELHVEKTSLYRNYYYGSDYLESYIKNIFSKETPLYIIFNAHTFVPDKTIYDESLKYYSEGKINKVKNCKPISNRVLNTQLPIFICRLK